MKKSIFALCAVLLMVSCKTEKKSLVLYYSQSGTTKIVAEEIQRQTGADICSYDVVQAYDGTYDETVSRCQSELSSGYIPDLVPLEADLSEYDVIFLGYPIWFGSYAQPVKALLASEKFEGKTIVPFCTFGSGGLQVSVRDLKTALPDAGIKDGYGVRTARVGASAVELNRFLIENGWKAGEIAALPEYSELVDVDEETSAIFDAACSDYIFPLGTPVKVGSRKVPGGTEYLFAAESQSADGQISTSKVYVTAMEGAKPEFTQVAR